MTFGQRLASERKRLGMLGAEFAAACGVATQSQSLYENDKRSPDADYLMKACALGADPAFLLVGQRVEVAALEIAEEKREWVNQFVGLSPKVQAAAMALLAMTGDRDGEE